ncbi:MAG: GIY-YIG nuclease family protein [Desulfobulbus oligotrophicus]|jgi:putative endonuclease|nr:GIY-YIG nuclease family protein [Desulfobulbus oligotrophicus]
MSQIGVIPRVVAESSFMQERHMEEKHTSTPILASKRNGTLYTGVTSNLEHRIYEHKNKTHTERFSAKYTVQMLVWYESGEDIQVAIELEKKIKTEKEPGKLL